MSSPFQSAALHQPVRDQGRLVSTMQRVDIVKLQAVAAGKADEVVPVTRGLLDIIARELATLRQTVAAQPGAAA
ncbi:hypothetical protein ASE70_08055 [Sphingomonas sp. Leaf22]|nr:hypothetical protein ASE70_08055 [Sphingomonas sp. Leaf22]